MAALYLHNAIFSREPVPPSHSRTWSNATLRTVDEPLLDYNDTQTNSAVGHGERERDGVAMARDTWRKSVRNRLRVLKKVQRLCAFVFGAWSVYTATRYMLRYTTTGWRIKEILSLTLGTSALLSIAFLIFHTILSLSYFHRRLLETDFPLSSLYRVKMLFRIIASVFMVTPALVNFSMTFVWIMDRKSLCSSMLDIDLIWGGEQTRCTDNKAGWIAMAVVRLFVTLAIIIGFNISAWSYQRTRHPSMSLPSRKMNLSVDVPLLESPPLTSSPRQDITRHPPQSHRQSPSHSSSTLRQPSSSSSEKLRSPSTSTSASTLMSHTTPPMLGSPLPTEGSNDEHELQSFADRFRALVSQISRETDDAVRFAIQPQPSTSSLPSVPPPDQYPSFSPYAPQPPPLSSNNPYSQYVDPYTRSYSPASYLAYNEFGLPYPPDERVSMLGGYVRRMPTIESLGSREATRSRGNTIASYAETLSRGNSLYLPGDMAAPFVDENLEDIELGLREGSLRKEEAGGTGSTGMQSYHTAVDHIEDMGESSNIHEGAPGGERS